MKNKAIILITAIVIIMPMFVGIVLWNRLPDAVAIHFNAAGNVDNWCDKEWAVFGIPLFILAAQIFCLFMREHDPKRKNISDKVYHMIIWIAPACSVIGGIIMYANALGMSFSVLPILQAVFGIGIMIVGNFLPKCRQNYTIGIKLPWTLSDKDNWNSTHRFAGKVWIIGGLIMVVNAFINSWIISLAVMLLLIAAPFIYSLVYHRKHTGD